MKRITSFLLSFFLFVSVSAQQAHHTDGKTMTNGIGGTSKSTVWNIKGTAVDTSDLIYLYEYGTFKFNWLDTTGTRNDSVAVKAELYTSSVSRTFDSTYTYACTVFNSTTALAPYAASGSYTGGWTRPIPLAIPVERFGVLIITGLTGNTKKYGLWGRVYYNGSTSQGGATMSK